MPNLPELRRYVRRVSDRWPVEGAYAKPSDAEGGRFLVVLVSHAFDGVPWLERVRQAESLWDAVEMGARAEVHCYTPVEFGRKRSALATVRDAAEKGIDLLAAA